MIGRLLATLGSIAAFGLPAVAASPAAAATSWTFDYTGVPQIFTVPAEVHKLSMFVVGGAGEHSPSNLSGPPGGTSGMVFGTFAVTPGEKLTIWVGAGASGSDGGWGFGCGGFGGEGDGITAQDGGGGGAASAVTAGAYPVPPGECGSRPAGAELLAVGGGGGGGGANALVPPPKGGLSLGGPGGDGGDPAGAGGSVPAEAPFVHGGCGGCLPEPNGEHGAGNGFVGGGAGGGGGGVRGGAGGEAGYTVGSAIGGAGGGGGTSFLGSGVEQGGYQAGTGSGDGYVTLTSLPVEIFQCTGGPQHTTVPANTGQVRIEAAGGHGGSRGVGLGGSGGLGGSAAATFPVSPGWPIDVYVGCQGTRDPGWGWGSGGADGQAPSPYALDGASGGGSSGLVLNGRLALVAGGGGGGGGNGEVFGKTEDGVGGQAGGGGDGGFPAGNGGEGEPEDYAGGKGGRGACCETPNGGSGGNAGHGSLAGGGGGGGAGWLSGAGGKEGTLTIGLVGGGGGGGGGGLSGISANSEASDFSYGTRGVGGDGLVELTYLPPSPTAVTVYGGAGQEATIGSRFAQPLAALVSDSRGQPLPDVKVAFALPSSGASGSFASGGTTQTVTTGANGVATTAPLSANLAAGKWEATASVEGVAKPARFSLVNAASATATFVTASRDPATPTEPVTFTATVSAARSTAGTPSGPVQFSVDGADLGGPVALSGGTATSIPATGLAPGSHEIEARFEGDPAYLPSSGWLDLPVRKTATATSVSSSLNPALPTESVTFIATITVPAGNAAYDGSVQFSVDGTPLGPPQTATDGTATSPPFATTAVGSHPVRAATAETADYLGSEGSLTEVVDPDGTAVVVGSSANPVEFGAPLELEAAVVPRPPVTLTPTGTVGFEAGGQECDGILSGGETSCSLPAPLAPGPHDVAATYSGDGDYEPSGGSMVQQVTKARTLVTVGGTPAQESIYGEPITAGAEVERASPGGGTPTGSVQFALDGEPLGGPAPLGPQGASSAAVTPDAGPHVIAAAYGGDAEFLAADGRAPYRVLPAPTRIELSAAPEPSQPAEPVSFSATVAALVPGSGPAVVPRGAVRFRVDGRDFGEPVPLAQGRAVAPAPQGFEPGRHDVTASFEPGSPDFEPSHVAIVHEVDEPTVTVLASSRNPAPLGAPVTLTAHVGPLATAGGVSFQVDGQPAPGCQDVSVEQSDATCALNDLAAGSHEVRAAFSGAPLLDPSQASLVQEIAAGPGPGPTPRPPPPCQLRDVRGRLLVHHRRNLVRLVARYRSAAPGKVTIRFFLRRGKNGRGRPLATMRRSFAERGRARVGKRLPRRLMKRLRHSGRGFIAEFHLAGDPGFCAQSFSRRLTIRRQLHKQLVWFQGDSKRARLPKNSR